MLIASLHHYNERDTDRILSSFITLPFTIVTVVLRLLCLSFILFESMSSFITVTVSITIINILSNLYLLRKQISMSRSSKKLKCCCLGKCMSNILLKTKFIVLKSFLGIINPIGYRDIVLKFQQQKLLLITNYFIVMTFLLTGVASSINRILPLTLKSINILSLFSSKPDIGGGTGALVKVSEAEVSVETREGITFEFQLPPSSIMLGPGNSSPVSSGMSMVIENKVQIVVVVCAVVVLLTLPITIVRASLIGLECRLVKQKTRPNDKAREHGTGALGYCSVFMTAVSVFMTIFFSSLLIQIVILLCVFLMK